MTSEAKVQANRRNARKSTGPRTPGGKALARLNALRHGVLSRTPIVEGEDPAAWDRHRDGVRESLGVVGVLEVALADRAALLLWRLDRLARADAILTSAHVTDALLAHGSGAAPAALAAAVQTARREASLADMRLCTPEIAAVVLAELPGWPPDQPVEFEAANAVLHVACEALSGVPDTLPDISEDVFLSQIDALDPDAWTAGKVRRGLAVLAACVGEDADWLAVVAARHVRDTIAERTRLRDAARERLAELEEMQRSAADQWAALALMPSGPRADLILRYEGHLQKMLTTTLHGLERLQAVRAGRDVPVPIAVDVAVTGTGE